MLFPHGVLKLFTFCCCCVISLSLIFKKNCFLSFPFSPYALFPKLWLSKMNWWQYVTNCILETEKSLKIKSPNSTFFFIAYCCRILYVFHLSVLISTVSFSFINGCQTVDMCYSRTPLCLSLLWQLSTAAWSCLVFGNIPWDDCQEGLQLDGWYLCWKTLQLSFRNLQMYSLYVNLKTSFFTGFAIVWPIHTSSDTDAALSHPSATPLCLWDTCILLESLSNG